MCTGALLLAAAGLLEGRAATTHWRAVPELQALGATFVDRRVVVDGNLMTAAGVSSGIDMALTLVARISGAETAKALQLAIEYDPQPFLNSQRLSARAESRLTGPARTVFAGLAPGSPTSPLLGVTPRVGLPSRLSGLPGA